MSINVVSNFEGIIWPHIASNSLQDRKRLIQQLLILERSPKKIIQQGQAQQLKALIAHCAVHSAHFKQRLKAAGIHDSCELTLDNLACVAVLTRRELQSAGEQFFCQQIPQSHYPLNNTKTSGSSGEPVCIKKTAVNHLYWLANTMREHLWWKRDFSLSMAVIRANLAQTQLNMPSWGPPVNHFYQSGPAHVLSMSVDTATQLKVLQTIQPHYLLTYPNNLADLLRICSAYWGLASSITPSSHYR